MWTRWLGALALCILTGCHLANNAVHNLTYEAKLATAEIQEQCNYEKLARASWQTVRANEDCRGVPKDYAQGFKDGFVDYLQFGGSGRPPFVPPKRYWGPRHRTLEGYRAVEAWYAGFRHGVEAAHHSGYRQWVTLPSAHTTMLPETLVCRSSGMAESVENNRLAPTCLPSPNVLQSSEPMTPTNKASKPRPQTNAPPHATLGAPISPAIPTSSHLHEPAKDILSFETVQAERPIVMQAPARLVAVVNPIGGIAPQTATSAAGLMAPAETNSTRRATAIVAPVVMD